MSNVQSHEFCSRLASLEKDAASRFEILKAHARVQGNFPDPTWSFAGRRLKFVTQESGRVSRAQSDPLPEVANKLARCFIVNSMEGKLSAEAVYGRLTLIRRLSDSIGKDAECWMSLNATSLNRLIDQLKNVYAETSVYTHAVNLRAFVKFLNDTRIPDRAEKRSLLGRRIRWKSGLKNPVKSSIEIGLSEVNARGDSKYVPTLHKSLGMARSLVRNNPSLEPTPGFDLIRLDSLSFPMATGIRIGELCSLPVRCFDTHEATGTRFVRVATEKGQPAAARPIADIWAPVVADAYDYLLERCAEARARAADIEQRGFAFVSELLSEARSLYALDPASALQVELLGLDPRGHFAIDEVMKALEVSRTEIEKGKYKESLVAVPTKLAAQIVRWIDERMTRWDWHLYATPNNDPRMAQVGSRALSITRLASLVGLGGNGNLLKATWLYPQLRKFLVQLSAAGAFEGTRLSMRARKELGAEWELVRAAALAKRGGARCSVVCREKFLDVLTRRYKAHLEHHFRDIVSIDEVGAPSVSSDVRAGMPLKLSEHLIVLWEDEFKPGLRAKRGLVPRPIFREDYYSYLSSSSQHRTVFQRLGINDDSGRPFSISPHQIRHWVTTAIFRSGPSEMMVDLWMGRARGQSRIYDHRTAKERAEALRERYLVESPPDDYLGRQIRLWRRKGISQDMLEEHVKSRLRVLHFVPTGGCSRELFLSPCTRGLMCLRGFGTDSACPSFHIDTNDKDARANIEALRDQYRAMLMALYPTADSLEQAFLDELNSTEVLDQHISHIRQVLRGCDQALRAYEVANPHVASVTSQSLVEHQL